VYLAFKFALLITLGVVEKFPYVNMLFYVLASNSYLKYTLSFMLSYRVQIALFEDYSKIRVLRIWLFIRYLILIYIGFSPLLKGLSDANTNFYFMSCRP
jgi:hypothetical protein